MQAAIKHLKHKRGELIERIKAGEHDLIPEKTGMEHAIAWLIKISELQLEKVNHYDFLVLPDMQTGYSEYHLMNDCESGDILDWLELKDEKDYPITLTPGDILLSHRPGC